VKCAWLLISAVLVAPAAWSHDVSAEVSGSLVSTSQDNPRAGSVGLMVSGGWDVSDSFSLFTNLGYTRELATRNSLGATSGADVLLLAAGALWLPSDSWMAVLTALGSPPSRMRSASTYLLPARTVDVVVDSTSWTLGGLWTLSWLQPPHDRPWSSMVDFTAGATWFDVFQQLVLPDTPAGDLVRAFCARPDATPACALVRGASSPLLQVRLGGGYTGTLFEATDFGVEVQGFLYDRNPDAVGYFSVLNVGRGPELGSGVPVLPLAVSVRPSVLHRFWKVSLKLAYQWGLYTGGQGSNHVVTLRATWNVTERWRLQGTLTGQMDSTPNGLKNVAGIAVLGVTVVF
jgi:hypothetical protein